MDNIQKYIESGMLEMYVVGVTSEKENAEVEKMASMHYEVKEEIKDISDILELYSQEEAIQADPTIKPFLMAVIDYTERLKNGEIPSFPPVLHENSKILDYQQWINNPYIQLPENFENFYAKIIGYSPTVKTAIIWIKNMAPEEVHTDELEKFLILEGTCDITIEDKVFSLKAGDYLSIPLFKKHDVKITSSIACKAILQRIAA